MSRSKIIKKSSPSLTSPFQFLIIACAFLECLPLSHRTCERSEESREIIIVDRGGREGKERGGAYDPGLSRGMARGGNKKGNKPRRYRTRVAPRESDPPRMIFALPFRDMVVDTRNPI